MIVNSIHLSDFTSPSPILDMVSEGSETDVDSSTLSASDDDSIEKIEEPPSKKLMIYINLSSLRKFKNQPLIEKIFICFYLISSFSEDHSFSYHSKKDFIQSVRELFLRQNILQLREAPRYHLFLKSKKKQVVRVEIGLLKILDKNKCSITEGLLSDSLKIKCLQSSNSCLMQFKDDQIRIDEGSVEFNLTLSSTTKNFIECREEDLLQAAFSHTRTFHFLGEKTVFLFEHEYILMQMNKVTDTKNDCAVYTSDPSKAPYIGTTSFKFSHHVEPYFFIDSSKIRFQTGIEFGASSPPPEKIIKCFYS